MAGLPAASTVKLYVGLGTYKIGLCPRQMGGYRTAGVGGKRRYHEAIGGAAAAKKVGGMMFYSYSYFLPDSVVPSSGQTYDRDVAKREVENLLTLLR